MRKTRSILAIEPWWLANCGELDAMTFTQINMNLAKENGTLREALEAIHNHAIGYAPGEEEETLDAIETICENVLNLKIPAKRP